MNSGIMWRGLGGCLALLLCAEGARAVEDLSRTVSKKQPVMMTANRVDYDTHTAIATASGNVQLVQGDTILLADKVTYNQNTNMVHAIGHVSVLEPTGDVFFSDDAELRNDMQKGVVQQFRARLKDNSLFAAREGRRVSKQVTKLKDVVYSPCHVCAAEEQSIGAMPLWQVEASKATIDEDAKRIKYQNAVMEVYGIPAIYTPYFSTPTPDAPNQSGLLQPIYMHDSILGSVIKEPVYYTVAPNLDFTLTPWYMTAEKPLLEGEMRAMTKDASLYIHGAIDDAYNRNDLGDEIPGSWTRGFLEVHAHDQLDKYWDVGFDGEHASDDTVLQFYHFGWQDMLTSRLYAERIEDRNYFDIESLAFQGLDPEDLVSAAPYVLPQSNLHLESGPLDANSRATLDANVLELTREVGDSDQRASATGTWKVPYITSGGQVFQVNSSVRGDEYHVNDLTTDTATGAQFNGDVSRFIPQVDFNWRYPFINHFGKEGAIMIAPVVEVTESPDLHQNSDIPNEDSQVAELSDINLFSPDRYTGLDEVESGLRGAYGMRGQAQINDDKYIEWLFGQAYQQNENSQFPLTSTQYAHYSDYIGRLALKYDALELSYAFRLNRESFAPTTNEVNIAYIQKPFNFDISYLSLTNEPLFGDRKEVWGSMSVDVTQNWQVIFGGREDLGSSQEQLANSSLPESIYNPLEPTTGTVGLSGGLIYHNECINILTLVSRSYITELDVKPSTTVGVTLVLKNFGAPDPQALAANIAGPGNITAIDGGASMHMDQNIVNPAGAADADSSGSSNPSGSDH